MFNGARIVGPAAAGILVDRYGVPIAFLLNGVSFMAVIVALVQIRAEGLPQARRDSSVLQDVVVGVRYAMGTPELRFILRLMLSVSLFVMNHVGSISDGGAGDASEDPPWPSNWLARKNGALMAYILTACTVMQGRITSARERITCIHRALRLQSCVC